MRPLTRDPRISFAGAWAALVLGLVDRDMRHLYELYNVPSPGGVGTG